MGFTSTMAMAAGAGMSAVGAMNKAQSQQDMLNSEANVADMQARQAIINGQTNAQSSMLRTGAVFGGQRAQLGANGVDLGSGSATDLLASTKYMGARDAMTIQDNALRTAWSYSTQSAMDRTGASNINPTMAGMSSLLGSSGSVASSWYNWQKQGGTMPSWAGGNS